MAFTTRARLSEYVSHKQAIANLNEASLGLKLRGIPKVFLSHSHSDTALIEFAELLLKKEGAGIYVDHKDPALPSTPEAKTADILRKKIVECQQFVMLASDKAIASRWVPWELGYADGKKTLDHIAVLPVLESEQQWTGSEYVGLYPTIQEVFNEWRICQPGSSYGFVTLKDWLHSGRD